jgi:hypothetical protein
MRLCLKFISLLLLGILSHSVKAESKKELTWIASGYSFALPDSNWTSVSPETSIGVKNLDFLGFDQNDPKKKILIHSKIAFSKPKTGASCQAELAQAKKNGIDYRMSHAPKNYDCSLVGKSNQGESYSVVFRYRKLRQLKKTAIWSVDSFVAVNLEDSKFQDWLKEVKTL